MSFDQTIPTTKPQEEENEEFLQRQSEGPLVARPIGVKVHPIVLLSAVDHFNRLKVQHGDKRVVGVLLGSIWKGVVDVTNCFAVPFEEDPTDPDTWFVNHNFIENMYGMYRRVNAREVIVGWYSAGSNPTIKKSDIHIHQLFRRYIPHPVFVIIDVDPSKTAAVSASAGLTTTSTQNAQNNVAQSIGLPVKSFVSIQEKKDEKSEPTDSFTHLPSEIESEETESIGVEHLLRDVKIDSGSKLSASVFADDSDVKASVSERISALKMFRDRLLKIKFYLRDVLNGKLPINHQVLYNLQNVFNLLPNLSLKAMKADANVLANPMEFHFGGKETADELEQQTGSLEETKRAFTKQTNDSMLSLYIASLLKTVVSIHDLIMNKIELTRDEKPKQKKVDEKEKKEKEEKEKKEKEGEKKEEEKKTEQK